MAVWGPLESAVGSEKGAEAEAKEQAERVEDVVEEKEVGAAVVCSATVEDVAAEKEAAVAAVPAEVEEVVADMVTSVGVAALSTPERLPAAASPRPTALEHARGGRQRKTSSELSRKRRRGVLQDSVKKKEEGDVDAAGAVLQPQITLACVVNGDANMMPVGTDQCTGLNSDEDPALEEENEDHENDDEDNNWEEGWEIGKLTDEDSDEEPVDLPGSLCSSTAMNKKTMSMMRTNGWEYGTLCWVYPTYVNVS
jgi:hypothetical protein